MWGENKISITKYVYTCSIFFFRGDRLQTQAVQVGLGRDPGWGPAIAGVRRESRDPELLRLILKRT